MRRRREAMLVDTLNPAAAAFRVAEWDQVGSDCMTIQTLVQAVAIILNYHVLMFMLKLETP
jgi:hypothetical protein